MKKLNLLFALCITLSGLAQVPVRWVVESARAAPAQISCYRGETLLLQPTIKAYGDTLSNYTASVWWQTNGMGSSWWSTNALVFSPEMDVGASAYTLFIQADTTNGKSYRANAVIRMLSAPGATPNALPLPVQSIDFSAVSTTNAPWLLASDLDPVHDRISYVENGTDTWNTAYSWGNHASAGYQIAGQSIYITEEGGGVLFPSSTDLYALWMNWEGFRNSSDFYIFLPINEFGNTSKTLATREWTRDFVLTNYQTASETPVTYIPFTYISDAPNVEEHLKGIDAQLGIIGAMTNGVSESSVTNIAKVVVTSHSNVVATASRLGHIKGGGTNVSIRADGTLDITASGESSAPISWTPIVPVNYGTVATASVTTAKACYSFEVSTAVTFTNDLSSLPTAGCLTNYEWEVAMKHTTTNSLSVTWDPRIIWQTGTPDLSVTGRYVYAMSTFCGTNILAKQTFPTVYQWEPALKAGTRNVYATTFASGLTAILNQADTNAYCYFARNFYDKPLLFKFYTTFGNSETYHATNRISVRFALGNNEFGTVFPAGYPTVQLPTNSPFAVAHAYVPALVWPYTTGRGHGLILNYTRTNTMSVATTVSIGEANFVRMANELEQAVGTNRFGWAAQYQ